MKNPLKIFHIQREERWPALAVLLYVATLNALVVGKYFDKFTQLSDNYHKLFVDNFAISGFDPLTYAIWPLWYLPNHRTLFLFLNSLGRFHPLMIIHFEPLVGFEPTTPRLQITCSGQLS